MTQPAYALARAAIPRLLAHFADHAEARRRLPEAEVAPEPDAAAIEAIIDAAFWASLRREEGYSPKISLALLPPAQSEVRMAFEHPLPLAPEPLTRLAPAVERPGIHLGVWPEHGQFRIWGATRSLPAFCFVLEVVAPGVLVVKKSRGRDAGKFVNVAVLEGHRIDVLDAEAARQPDAPALLTSLMDVNGPTSPPESASVLTDLAISMRAHGRGGTLLVVPGGSETWRQSVVRPIRYSVVPPFSRLAQMLRDPGDSRQERRWQEGVRRAVDAIAGLTAVDGATVITDRFELLAFGATIAPRQGGELVEKIVVNEPLEGSTPQAIPASQLGGTRHLSGAQFVWDQRDTLALVASQDGRFTVFAWSQAQETLQAHRIEALLL